MQGALQLLQRRHHQQHGLVHVPYPAGLLRIVDQWLPRGLAGVELVQQLTHPAAEQPRLVAGIGGYGPGRDDAGDGGMDARALHADPEKGGEDEVGQGPADATQVERVHQDGDQCRQAEIAEIDLGGIEQGDHGHRSQVVDDGQRDEKGQQPPWHPVAEQRHDTDGEGDVGRHRDPPAAHSIGTGVEPDIEQRRHHHAADGGDHRQHGIADVRQLPHQHLALDLQSDHEEEDGHQAVVDPVVHRVLEDAAASGEAHLQVKQVLIGLVEGAVGDDQGDDGTADEQDAGGGLAVQELLERGGDAFIGPLPGSEIETALFWHQWISSAGKGHAARRYRAARATVAEYTKIACPGIAPDSPGRRAAADGLRGGRAGMTDQGNP